MAGAVDPGRLAMTGACDRRVQVSPFEAALEAQRTFMDKYGDPLEQLLQVGVCLVPVQDDQDISGFWSQVVYSLTDLFNLYRTVLLRSPDDVPVEAPLTPSSSSTSPTLPGSSSTQSQGQWLLQLRRTYTVSAFALRTLRSVQVLLEMQAVRSAGGNTSARRVLQVCLRIEVLKLLLKLLLKSLMPFSFYIDEDALEEVEPPKSRRMALGQGGKPGEAASSPLSTSHSTAVGSEVYIGKRSGRTLPSLDGSALPSAGPATISRLIDDRSAATLRMSIAEVLYHGRPLVHLLMMDRQGTRSWSAWLFALIADRISLALLASDVRPRFQSRAASLEWAEFRRRRNASWWALARSPFFDKFFQSKADAIDSVIRRIPIVNLFNIVELSLALRPFYFSTSGT